MLFSLRAPRLRAHRRTLSISQVNRVVLRIQLTVLGLILLLLGYIIYVYSRALSAGADPLAAIQRDAFVYAPHRRPSCTWRRWQRERFAELGKDNRTVFIAANFWNNEEVLPTFFQELPKLLSFLGPKSAYVSVYENGSSDKTRGLLNLLDEALDIIGTPHSIISDHGGQDSHKIPGQRIPVLAATRNKALAPLYSASRAYDEILFLNDVYHCATDLIELLYQKRAQGANQACATDWDNNIVYDRWPLRAMSGRPFYRHNDLVDYFHASSRDAPVPPVLSHTSDESDRARFAAHAPLQVFSCWNGATVIDSAPFVSEKDPLRFRTSHTDFDDHGRARNMSEKASECFLIDVDLWKRGTSRIALVPKASVAHSLQSYNRHRKDKLQPLPESSEKITWVDSPPARVAMQDFGAWHEPERWAPWDEQ